MSAEEVERHERHEAEKKMRRGRFALYFSPWISEMYVVAADDDPFELELDGAPVGHGRKGEGAALSKGAPTDPRELREEPSFELDFDQGEGLVTAPDVDEMEFDPLSIGGASVHGTEPGAEWELHPSAPALAFPTASPNLADPRPTDPRPSDPRPSDPRPSNPSAGSQHPSSPPDELRGDFDLLQSRLELVPSRPPPGLSPTASPRSDRPGSHSDAVSAASAVPDLEVPALDVPKKKPTADRAAQRRAPAISAPALDLDYGSKPDAPNQSAARTASIAPRASLRPSYAPLAPHGRASEAPRASLRQSYASDFGGLDELGFEASERASDLQLSIAPAQRDELPWPLGRTPYEDELDVSREMVHSHGYGPAPVGLAAAPVYAWRVWSRRAAVQSKRDAAQSLLRHRESARDEKLAALAEHKRSEVEGQERFAPLFQKIDQLTAEVEQKTKELEAVDAEGAEELRSIERGLKEGKQRRLEVEARRDEARLEHEERKRQVLRLGALSKRLQIEDRNLEARIDNGSLAEAEFRQQRDELHEKIHLLAAQLTQEQKTTDQLALRLEQAEDAVRIAIAEQLGKEAALEAHLIAIEGKNAERSAALVAARDERTARLAEIGRSIVELRGSVPVEVSTRKELLELEGQVRDAAHQARAYDLAAQSIDPRAYGWGRAILFFAAIGLALLIAYLIGR